MVVSPRQLPLRFCNPNWLFLGALFLLVACNGSGGGGGSPAAEATIAPTGGELVVTDGPLAGLKVEIPADAVAAPVRITAGRTFAAAVPGFQVSGRAVTLGPLQQFRAPVHVTLPFDASTQSGNELVVMLRDGTGRIVEIAPSAIDSEASIVEFDTLTLGTCWVAERLFLGVGTEEFLLLQDGDVWEFENGLSMALTMEFEEPNFASYVYKLRLTGPDDDLSFYLDRHWSGTTELLGTSSSDGNGWQQLHERRRWMPARMTVGRPVVDTFVREDYTPLGTDTPTRTGTTTVELLAEHGDAVETPAETFDDVITLHFRTRDLDASGPAQSERELAITFARYTGPIAIEAFGQTGKLVRANVGGLPIGEWPESRQRSR